MKDEIKEKVWEGIHSWEDCEEVKAPNEEDKVDYAIRYTKELQEKETMSWVINQFKEIMEDWVQDVNDTEIILRFKQQLSEMEKEK